MNLEEQTMARALERIPQNMRDRISFIEHAADGSVTIYFDVEEKKEN